MRFHFTEQVAYDFYVGFADRILLNLTRFVERQIKEVATFQWNVIICTSSTGFTATDQTFDSQYVTAVHITVFLRFQEITYFCVLFIDNLVLTIVEDLVESVDEVHETNYFFITYSDIAGSFVCYVYFMFLLYQTAESSTHRDNVIIRMGRENNHTFRVGFCTFGTIGVVSIRLAARPSGDGVLQIIENFDIYIVCRTIKSQQFTQTVFIIILVGQFQNRFACQLAQPDNSATDQFVIPFAGSYQPRTLDACQIHGCRKVKRYMRIVVSLQIRSRNSIGDRTFHTFFNHSCFVLAPCKQIYFLCTENGSYSHRDRTDRSIIHCSENSGCFIARGVIQ